MSTPTTEEKIKTDVVNELFWDSRVNAANIGVEIAEGKVHLTGTVPTFYERTAVYNDVQTVTSGYLEIDNEIKVKHAENMEIPSDNEIKMRINSTLDWSSIIEAKQIVVNVVSGHVTINGTVTSFWEKQRVTTLVSDVSGVTGITNKLRVVPTKKVMDNIISKDIIDRLTRKSNVNMNEIGVKVENGVVTLTGTAQTWGEYLAVYDAARYTEGVVDIEDNLRVDEVVL